MAEREGDNIIVTIRRSKLFGKLPQEEEQHAKGLPALEICLIQDQIPVDHKADTVIKAALRKRSIAARGQAPSILLHRTDCRPRSSLLQAHVPRGAAQGKGLISISAGSSTRGPRPLGQK